MRLFFSSAAAVVALTGIVSTQNLASPPSYPSPWMYGGHGWQDAYQKAQRFVGQLTLLEKINLTTGVGWEGESCVGNTGSIPRLNFRGTHLILQIRASYRLTWGVGLCLQDSPLGVRDSKFNPVDMDRVS
jgi:hypothetical protein